MSCHVWQSFVSVHVLRSISTRKINSRSYQAMYFCFYIPRLTFLADGNIWRAEKFHLKKILKLQCPFYNLFRISSLTNDSIFSFSIHCIQIDQKRILHCSINYSSLSDILAPLSPPKYLSHEQESLYMGSKPINNLTEIITLNINLTKHPNNNAYQFYYDTQNNNRQ